MSSNKNLASIPAEELVGLKYRRCINDAVIKMVTGFLLGALARSFFFKCKKWPMIIGVTFGTGMAYYNCEKDVNDSFVTEIQDDPKHRRRR